MTDKIEPTNADMEKARKVAKDIDASILDVHPVERNMWKSQIAKYVSQALAEERESMRKRAVEKNKAVGLNHGNGSMKPYRT